MQCPRCAAAELMHDTRDMPYTCKGESTFILAVTSGYCPACGEVVLDKAKSILINSAMRDFNKPVNAMIVDPDFIASVRKKLALDQLKAAKIFGDVNAGSAS